MMPSFKDRIERSGAEARCHRVALPLDPYLSVGVAGVVAVAAWPAGSPWLGASH